MTYFEKKRKNIFKEIESNNAEIESLKEENDNLNEQIKELNKLEKDFAEQKGVPTCSLEEKDFAINMPEDKLKEINSWICQHEITFHPKDYFGLKDYSEFPRKLICDPIYSIHMGWTPLGRYIDLSCEYCKNRDTEKENWNDYTFSIEDL